VRATGGKAASKHQGSSSSSSAPMPLLHQSVHHSATAIGLKLKKDLFDKIDIKLAKFLVEHSFSEKEYVKRSIHNDDDRQ
jgi:hypothetical protein